MTPSVSASLGQCLQQSKGYSSSSKLTKNVGEVVQALPVLNLGDDLDVFSVLAQHLPDALDVRAGSDETCENHVYVVLDSKSKIGLVLFGQGREVDVCVGKVDALNMFFG